MTEAVTFANFNIHAKFNNYHKSEHILHILRKFQQITFTNNYSITNTNNKGSATRVGHRYVTDVIDVTQFPSHEPSTGTAPSGRGPVYKINYIIYYYVEKQLSTHILYKISIYRKMHIY